VEVSRCGGVEEAAVERGFFFLTSGMQLVYIWFTIGRWVFVKKSHGK
jgi:hypothetical protein